MLIIFFCAFSLVFIISFCSGRAAAAAVGTAIAWWNSWKSCKSLTKEERLTESYRTTNTQARKHTYNRVQPVLFLHTHANTSTKNHTHTHTHTHKQTHVQTSKHRIQPALLFRTSNFSSTSQQSDFSFCCRFSHAQKVSKFTTKRPPAAQSPLFYDNNNNNSQTTRTV